MNTIGFSFFDFVMIAFATLYLSEIITGKDGPFGVFTKLRQVPSMGLLRCVWCTAPYVALLMLGVYWFAPPVVWVFAVAGLALALRSYTGVAHA